MASDRAAAGPFRRALEWILAIDRFVRLHQLFFTALWPFLGAASVKPGLTAWELIALLVVTCCFHVYAYVLNDVVDLPIDRIQSVRRFDPLVRGAIRPKHALAIALIQPALTAPLTISLGGSVWAHVTLGVGFALMGAYDLWGKRCPFPPLTDAIQGLAWASLAIYAPLALGAEPTTLTWLVVIYATVLTLFFNGIHGSLRDLETDLAGGARTTAILLGARPSHGRPYIPLSVVIYASSLLVLLLATSAILLIRNDLGYSPKSWAITALMMGGLNLTAIVVHRKVVHPAGPEWNSAWRLQLYVVVLSLPAFFLASSNLEVLLVLLVLHCIALALFGSTSGVAEWAWGAIRDALGSGEAGRRVTARTSRTD